MGKTRFIENHERVKSNKIFSIFQSQKERFCVLLEEQDKKSFLEFIDTFVQEIAGEIPTYLVQVLPVIMKEGAKEPIKAYKKKLPKDYALSFDLPNAPAVKYLSELEDLMLSQRQGSISKTTRDELRRIITDGVEQGKSYTQVAQEIRQQDPFVFSRSRAMLIASNEIGKAYGWANLEPPRELQRQGYTMEKKWVTSHDNKVRKTHTQNQEQGWIALEEAWSGTGDMFAPSQKQIRCRCFSQTRIADEPKK